MTKKANYLESKPTPAIYIGKSRLIGLSYGMTGTMSNAFGEMAIFTNDADGLDWGVRTIAITKGPVDNVVYFI